MGIILRFKYFFISILIFNQVYASGEIGFNDWVFDLKRHRTLSLSIGNSQKITFNKTIFKTKRKPIRLFSLSKIFINLYIATLVKDKTISISTPINSLLRPYPAHWSKKITIRHLLEMSSGLRAPTNITPFWGLGVIKKIDNSIYTTFLNKELLNSIQALMPGEEYYNSYLDELILLEIINVINPKLNINQKFKYFFEKLGLLSTKSRYLEHYFDIFFKKSNFLTNFYPYPNLVPNNFFTWSTSEELFQLAQIFLNNFKGSLQFLPQGWAKYSWNSSIPPEKMLNIATNDNYHSFGALWSINSLNPQNLNKPFNKLPEDLVLIKGLFGQTIAVIPSKDFILVRLSDDKPNEQIDRQELILRALDI